MGRDSRDTRDIWEGVKARLRQMSNVEQNAALSEEIYRFTKSIDELLGIGVLSKYIEKEKGE